VRLLAVEPDLADYLSAEERVLVEQLAVPVHVVERRDMDIDALLAGAGAFATAVIDGLVLHRMAIGDQPALRLLGPGDILSPSGVARTGLFTQSVYRAPGRVRLAMLDDRVLLTARRVPRLFAALQLRMGEQYQRLAAQLVICQLPRVEDRILALMWLLAESWGRVGSSGTVLPVALTHDALGELIGARRSTVTLALKELTQRGALVRQGAEWLLLQPPPQGPLPASPTAEPQIIGRGSAVWQEQPRDSGPAPSIQRLEEIVATLRLLHLRNADEVQNRLDRSRQVMAHNRELRQRISMQQLRRRPAP